ncbi:hypothetical protein [Microcoleus sp. S13C4]|uniref:hypothetical protein n=1 Tax=Microcoleus sp. S13C4 TaxID=3055410 RepID=UPI002FD51ED0
MSQIKPITATTSEPTIHVPGTQPSPPQSLGGVTETILTVAVLVRSIALLIQALDPIVRKSGK